MIVFSDLHLRKESRDVVFNEVLPGIKQAALDEAYALSKKVHHGMRPAVLFLGDWYHLRYAVDIEIQNQVRDLLIDWAKDGIELFKLPGNHDQVDVAGRNALEVFDGVTDIHVINVPTWTPIGLFIPYRRELDELRAAIALPKPDPTYLDIAYMHVGLKGATRNNGSVNDSGIHADELKGFKMVLTGHYHRAQKIGHCHYIGSPYETRADEGGMPHGYVSFDPHTLTLNYHQTHWGPRHVHLSMNGGLETIDLKGVQARDRVTIDVKDPKIALDQVNAALQKIGVNAIVRPDYPEESTLRLGAQNSLKDYAFAYAEKFAQTGGLEPALLKRVFDEVTK